MNKHSINALRVVFDTNAFSPDTFELLYNGPMRQLCYQGRIVPLYGHVFLEETWGAYAIVDKRDDLINRWLPFIVDTCDRICNDFHGIWHEELVEGRGPHASILMPRRDYEKLVSRIPNIPIDGTWSAWQNSQGRRDHENAKRAAQRKIHTEIRREVAQRRKAIGYSPKKHAIPPFELFSESEVDEAGREFLPLLVPAKNPRAIARRWSRAKMQYPYFTMFNLNMAYLAHFAATRNNEAFDLNAQADLNLMTHLLRADALVSNETGFLKTAFDDLWKPRGKVLFTSKEFADFIAKL